MSSYFCHAVKLVVLLSLLKTLTIIAENITVLPELKFEILREIEFVHFNVSTSRTITHIVNPLLSKLLLQQIFCMPEFHLTHLQTL